MQFAFGATTFPTSEAMDRAVRAEPLTLLELTVKRSIVSLLSKPQWWRKWQDPAIQTRWLGEIQLEFLHQTLQQHLRWTPETYCTLDDLMRIQQMPPSPEKDALAAEWLAVVRYENADMAGDRSEWEDSDDQEEGKNAYTSILWYFTYTVLRDTLLAIPVREWAADRGSQRHVGSMRAVAIHTLAHSMLKNGSSDDVVKDSLAGVESRPEAIEFLRSHCHTILEELVCVWPYIAQVINQIAKSDGLHVEIAATAGGGGAERVVVSPTGVHGSWISDNLIPAELKARFVHEVALLENVLDLIHPSLYCCVKGETKQVAKPPQELEAFSSPASHMAAIVLGATKPVESEYFTKTKRQATDFQWIPSDFLVREDGSVRILSYISNLHPANYASMYTPIEGIFARFVPLFERTLSALGTEYPKPFPDTATDFSTEVTRHVTLKGKKVQVIVKVAEILLTSESPKYNGGSWHIEGTDAEQIVATGIYYFGSENIRDSRLSFRVNVNQPYYEQSDDSGVAVMYGLFKELLVQQVGSVTTLEDHCLVFPNILQHKVEPFELSDPTVLGAHKILAFFLVGPEKTVPSTSVIPPQQQSWIDAVQEPPLKKLKLVDVAEQNVKDTMNDGSMTLEQAKEYRLKLMEMRSTNDDKYGENSYFNLCEH